MKRLIPIAISFGLAGCASVTAIPLHPDGTVAEDEAPGIRYYLPKPYLLVAQVPIAQSDDKNPDSQHSLSKGASDDAKASEADPKSSNSAPSAASDTSFGMTTQQYTIKLVYLPDFAHPMALEMTGGLFGSAEAKPSLQDGWMLTSLDETADNTKLPDTLSSLASLAAGSAAKGAATATQETKTSLIGAGSKKTTTVTTTTTEPYLQPGLYEFVYGDRYSGAIDKAFTTAGQLIGVRAVAYFCSDGVHNAPDALRPPKPCSAK